MKIRLRSVILLLVSSIALQAQVEFSGYYQNWVAVRTSEEYDIMLIRNRLRLDGNLYGEAIGGYFSLDIRDDAVVGETDFEITLREAYIDLLFSQMEFRLGKQQVVWGKADGLFINDIVCPLDMRMFLLQDFDNIRMGLPMAKVNLYLENWTLEGLWIPEFEPWQFAESGSDWEFTLDIPPDTIWIPIGWEMWIPKVIHLNNELLPNRKIKNSEIGLKLSTYLFDTDLSLLYLNGYNDFPFGQIDSTITTIDPTLQVPTSLDTYITPTYYRSPMYGLNFSRPLFATILRGELGYYLDRRYTDESLQTLTSNFFQGMLGLDLTGPWGSFISFQVIHTQIMDFKREMVDDESEEMATVMISGSFLREMVIANILGLVDVNNNSGLGRLDISYEMSEGLRISLGGFLLWGNDDSLFGQFDTNDNVYLKVKYSF